MTISQALIIVLLISIWASTTNTDLATNSTILIILLIALIALAGVTSINENNNRCCCRNRIISTGTITQTLF
ncbi:MAG: hypothetical protein J6C13_03135 [Clostridia bacterium]|nr:hypothetical protein [Clostridia bacterium]